MKILALMLIISALSISARAEQNPPLATEADRAKPAPMVSAPAYALKQAAKAALSNGLTVSVIESHRLPIVAVTLIVPQASDETDPIGREGLSAFVAGMAQEGVPGLPTAAALSGAIEDLGLDSIPVASGNAGLSVSFLVLKENLEWALNLADRIVRDPAHLSGAPEYEQALERMRQRSLAALDMQKGDAAALAGKRLASSLFGDTPRGRSATKASLRAITLQDISQHQRATLSPNGAVLAVAGDVTLDELKAMAGDNFGSWAPPQSPNVATPRSRPVDVAPSQTAGLVVELIDMPGAQAEILVGAKTLPRLHPDHDALYLAVTVLGGPMFGRLDQNIRETHSWAYGARAKIGAWKNSGDVTMECRAQVDRTSDTLHEILAEAARLADVPVPEAELREAKTYLKETYLSNNDLSKLSMRQAAAETLGLPASSLTDFPVRMDTLTAGQVQAAAKTWLSPSSLKIVIAGPAGVILPQLKALKEIGAIKVFDVDGRSKTASNG